MTNFHHATCKIVSALAIVWVFIALSASGQENQAANKGYITTLQLIGAQQYDEAIEGLERIIQMYPKFGKAYWKLVTARAENNQLGEAQEFFEELIAKDPDNPYAYYGLGLVWKKREEYRRASESYMKSLRLFPEYASSYEELIGALKALKELDEARSYIDAILKSNPQNAAAWYGRAYLYGVLSKWEKTAESAEKALQLDPDLLEAYFLKGFAYTRSAQYQEALQVLAAGLQRSDERDDLEFRARFLRSIGIANGRLGNYPRAFQSATNALRIFREIGNREWISTCLGDLGMYSFEIGDYKRSMEYYEQALEISRKIGDKKGQARHLSNMGIVNSNMGKYPEALEYYESALAIDRELGNKRGEGIRLSNIAVVYHDLGDYLRAKATLIEALAISRKIGDRRSEGINLVNIGAMYEALGDYSKALEFYQAALKNATEIGYRKVQGAALQDIGNLYRRSGDFRQARTYYEKSLKIANETQDERLKGYVFNTLGNLSLELEEYVRAANLHRQALDIGDNLNEVNVVFEAHTGLASTYEKQGLSEQALSHYRTAVEKVESVRGLLELEQHKLAFLDSKIEIYERLIDLLATLDRAEPSGRYAKEAFHFAERAKARALLDILQRGRTFQHLDAISEEFRRRILANEKKLQDAHRRLSAELSRTKHEVDSTRVLSIEYEIESLSREQAKLSQQLRERYPGFYKLTNPDALTSRQVQRMILSDNQVMVEYFVGERKTYAWILTKDRLSFRVIDLTREELQAKLARISPIFLTQKEPSQGAIDYRWANIRPDLLYELYQILLDQPFGEFLVPGTELIIVPDDILFYFPFEILVTDMGPDEIRYLVERYPISYASSASLLNPELRQPRKPRKDLLAIGNPDFGGEQSKGMMAWVSGLASLIVRGGRFEQLPHAEEEVQAIARNFEQVAVYTGRQATEERFKERAGDFRFIHLATHSLPDDRQPMYSKIVLAQNGEGAEDGYLQTYEVFNLKLNAEMVVLSGCSTGLGKLSRGEGLIGMTRAFLYAGVPSLVVSLWPVNDESTALLMQNFYRYLNQGEKKNRALQRAKIDLIRSTDWKKDPFYWGAFVLIGG
jgi:tetratricopeptide (TPR) repeat protein